MACHQHKVRLQTEIPISYENKTKIISTFTEIILTHDYDPYIAASPLK